MKKINTAVILGLLCASFSTATFATSDNDGHGSSHGDGHSMEGHEGHKMSAVGMPAEEDSKANKTITVHMMDTMKFNFSKKDIEQGDIIKFVVMNKGKIAHEFGIGSVAEQKAHREMMKSMPNMKHDDGATVMVAPGKTAELVWQFIGEDAVQFACNVPGHFEAGMYAEAELH